MAFSVLLLNPTSNAQSNSYHRLCKTQQIQRKPVVRQIGIKQYQLFRRTRLYQIRFITGAEWKIPEGEE